VLPSEVFLHVAVLRVGLSEEKRSLTLVARVEGKEGEEVSKVACLLLLLLRWTCYLAADLYLFHTTV
jgi:hypothetical protein